MKIEKAFELADLVEEYRKESKVFGLLFDEDSYIKIHVINEKLQKGESFSLNSKLSTNLNSEIIAAFQKYDMELRNQIRNL